MLKKGIYILAGILVIVLGYLNYFKEEKAIEVKSDNKIETSDVNYESEGYRIEAGTQIDDLDTKETSFKLAKAFFEDMSLKGDSVFIDSLKNLILNGNIEGVSVNGWKFNAENANYDSDLAIISSETGVTASNDEKNIKVSGRKFETDIKMSYVNLDGDILMESEKIKVSADKVRYSDDTKIADITGDIRVRGENLSEDNPGSLEGIFENARYNLDSKILEAWNPFVIDYNGVKLYGEKLVYYEETGDFLVSENVRAEKDGFTLYMDSIEHKSADNLVVFHGEIHGGDEIYSVKGKNGYYDTLKKQAELKGDVVVSSKDGKELKADRGVYETETKVLYAYGATKDVVYKSPEGKVTSREIVYKSETEELFLNKKYTFSNQEYTSKGEKFYYNNLTGAGKAEKGDIKSKEFYGKGNLLEFNTQEKYYEAVGDAYFENADYSVESSKLTYDQSSGQVTVPGKYTARGKNKNEIFKGLEASYNTQSGDFVSPGKFFGENADYNFEGVDLTYNKISGIGKIDRDIVITGKTNNTKITGDRGNFKNGEFADIIGNIIVESKDITATGNKATYKQQEDKVYIPGEIKLKGKKSDFDGIMRDGVFDTEKSVYTGKAFKGKSDTATASGDTIKYYTEKDSFELIGNVILKDPETEVRGSQAEYFIDSNEVSAKEPFKIFYDNLVINSARGKFNMDSKSLDGNKVVITSDKGEKLQGDHVFGSFADKKVDFVGNVKASMYQTDKKTGKKEPVNFEGNSARVYFIEDNGYKANRSEIKDNGVFRYSGMTLHSDYLELDLVRNLALGREGSRLIMENGTEVTSDIVDVNLTTEVANLINNVEITNFSQESGYTKATADRGIIKNKEKIAELEGRVKAESATATIEADRGIYNMNTNKFKAIGNVFINYKTN
ncbi:LptA/OstA family protein [uncultured Ilyobacter sp.]|uniref:LptA/OstA family protein n=1 Tax=uncultured Ilyobacter sp. TaxID=544433 RepID=UPI002AA6D69F|nr:LptA/OstA family protein [uncultured Ilyobacter sp.]